MLQIQLVCVGRMKEKFYIDAAGEYLKRLSAYCKLETAEIHEARVPKRPSPADVDAALKEEAELIEERLTKKSALIAMCVEGEQTDSHGMAQRLEELAVRGSGKLSFVIGGSYGLHEAVKNKAVMKLSFSKLTFPHHLVRIMLLEQIYRSFKILEGGKYHK